MIPVVPGETFKTKHFQSVTENPHIKPWHLFIFLSQALFSVLVNKLKSLQMLKIKRIPIAVVLFMVKVALSHESKSSLQHTQPINTPHY